MIPRLPIPDATLRFAADGYRFVTRQARAVDSDVFRTRLMFRDVVCAYGAEAAHIFYEGGRFGRAGAMPLSVMHLLQDEGSVQALEGAAHDHRKLMFLAAQRDEQISALRTAFDDEWHVAARRWAGERSVNLYREAVEILARTAVRWAGIPAACPPWLGDHLSTMVDRAATFGPPNWAARARRNRTEAWAREVVNAIRSGDLQPGAGSLAAIIAHQRDLDDRELPVAVAAVELLNILRPTVAVARFIVFAALAMHQHPDDVPTLAEHADARVRFAHEVRRYYPFFPVIGGRVRTPFEWRGTRFDEGQWMLLDLFGTNRDERLWANPDRFDPDRFLDWDGDPNTLIPQGGGDVAHGHRCPGETATVALVAESVRLLAETDYVVPPQDLRISLRRIPALPQSDFIIERVGRSVKPPAGAPAPA
jgi:fatty-acid peroxygenase